MAIEQRLRHVREHGDKLFEKRGTLLSLWQETADNFYPERADFTITRMLGTEFAAHLDTSYPILCRRDLGNTFSGMLRPSEKDWFHIRPTREELETARALRWLEMAEKVQRRAMYDRASQFVRATKEGDHDFAAFGQCALSVELNRARDALLYRCWHLRDMAWAENEEGKVTIFHRNWKPQAFQLAKMFKGKTASQINDQLLRQDPFKEITCRHVVVPSDTYDSPQGTKWKTPFVSIYFDLENDHVMEEVGLWNPMYVIPRWQTVSGSQYSFSPATVAALPDARLIQAVAYTLMNAGERAASPPMIATEQAIRSDVQVFADGITWVDAEYDERMGEALRPIAHDYSGLPFSEGMLKDTREQLKDAFYLNKVSPPMITNNPNMTAYQAGQIVQEYIRQALPLFEPMESDYNGQICEITFDLLMRGGAFGPREWIPPELAHADIQFRFESPLREAADRMKGTRFLQAKELIAQAAPFDPMAPEILDARTALRDALTGIGTPPKWLRDPSVVNQIEAGKAKQAAIQNLVTQVSQGADVAQKVGDAAQALSTGFGGPGANKQPAVAA